MGLMSPPPREKKEAPNSSLSMMDDDDISDMTMRMRVSVKKGFFRTESLIGDPLPPLGTLRTFLSLFSEQVVF